MFKKVTIENLYKIKKTNLSERKLVKNLFN